MSSDRAEHPAQATRLANEVIEPIQAGLPSFDNLLSGLTH
jgi:hypothetical protein